MVINSRWRAPKRPFEGASGVVGGHRGADGRTAQGAAVHLVQASRARRPVVAVEDHLGC